MKILDACCSKRAFWVNKHHPDATYIDIRPEVNPDRIMDCRNTSFPDKTFDLIVFDPPHVALSESNKGIFAKKYGTITAKEIRILVHEAFVEFKRILKDDGFVVFKWNTHDQKLKTILPLISGFEILFGQLTTQRTKHSSQTFWFTLKKGEYQKEQHDLFGVA